MSTRNPLPYSNQFERGHSFNWAGQWTEGKYYMNDEYVTDFVVYNNTILACRKTHKASQELRPNLITTNGKITGIDSPYWEFVVSVGSSTEIVSSSTYIAEATKTDEQLDESVIVGDPYIKIDYTSKAYTYVPAKDLVVGNDVVIAVYKYICTER